MYKTIRHGENSLQYTILPQTDDFRIEGKLSNGSRLPASNNSASSASCSSSTHKKSNPSPRKRRTFFAYLGLIFVCTVIIGAVLIPFLVSAECLSSPTEWFLKTKAALSYGGDKQQHIAAGTAAVAAAAAAATNKPTPATLAASAMLGQNVGKTVQIVNRNGIEQFILKLNKTVPHTDSSSTTTSSTTSTTTTSTTTTAPTTAISMQAIEPPTTARSAFSAKILPLATVAAAAPPLGNRLSATITTRIIQVPLLKSAAKKPIMPPVLAKTQSVQQQQQQRLQQKEQQQQQQLEPPERATEVAKNRSISNAWLNTRWTYFVPSTYVQWPDYKAEDSVLLPALLGFALIGMILIITVCLVARNKRTIVSSVRKRNRNDIEEQGAEDNATLLTTANLSDDD